MGDRGAKYSMKIVKELMTYEKVPFPLLQKNGAKGILQSHLAKLLHFDTYTLSLLMKGMKTNKETLSSDEGKILKELGMISRYTRGGNFIMLDDVKKILELIDSEESGDLRKQLDDLQ